MEAAPRDSFSEKYGVHIQGCIIILFFAENLMIAFFKATIVYYLRFEAHLTENQSILSYHLFQTVSYFTAFINGIIAMQSMKSALIILLIFYLIGSGSIFFAFLGIGNGDSLIPLLIALFGLGHGALKAAIHRMVKTDTVGKSYGYLSLALIVLETLLVGIVPMFFNGSESFLVIILLVIVLLFLFISVFGSMFDKHGDELYDFGALTSATIYGLVGILVAAEEDVSNAMMNKKTKKKSSTKDKPEDIIQNDAHWMNRALGKYPVEMIKDLKEKFRLHKLYFGMAGLWIGIEMKYSYWIFSTYLTRRIMSEDSVFHPPQFVAITPIMFGFFAPLFYLIIRPMLSMSFYKNSLRQMCLGAFFVLSATMIGWRLAAMQGMTLTEFTEASLSQQKVRILNAYDCQSGFTYYFSMNPDLKEAFKPLPAINYAAGVDDNSKMQMQEKPNVEIITNLLLPSIEESFLRYANIRFLDKIRIGEVLWDKQESTDSFTYIMSVYSSVDHAVTLGAYGYCETLNLYSLEIPLWKNRSHADHLVVYVIQNKGKLEAIPYHNINYARNKLQKPGIRLYVAADDKPQLVTVSYGSNVIIKATVHKNDLQPPSDIAWVKNNDASIITVRSMGKKVQFNYTFKTAEVVDVLAYVHTNGSMMAKLLRALSPIVLSGFAVIPQYIIISIGEFFVGIVGIQLLISLAPSKLKFYVYIDWYLMLGFANLIIIIVSQVSDWVVLQSQIAVLATTVMTSFFLLIVMVCRL